MARRIVFVEPIFFEEAAQVDHYVAAQAAHLVSP
jgi:hypothetical protein